MYETIIVQNFHWGVLNRAGQEGPTKILAATFYRDALEEETSDNDGEFIPVLPSEIIRQRKATRGDSITSDQRVRMLTTGSFSFKTTNMI
jgi:hypothetical protein